MVSLRTGKIKGATEHRTGISRPGWGQARQSLLLESQSPGGGGGGEPVIHEDVKVAGGGGVQLANAKLWS